MLQPLTPAPEAPSTSILPERLRAQTRDLHALSERSGVMAQLLRAELALPGYCALLRNLQALYAALEAALTRNGQHPALVALDLAVLQRESALAADLQALAGPGWHGLPLAPALQAYVRRLDEIAARAPLLLVAHVYVRYLGDLHGGQMLKHLVARSLCAGHTADAATRFYDFGSDEQVQALRRRLRSGLALISVDEGQADSLVAEARWAFAQHVALFEQLV